MTGRFALGLVGAACAGCAEVCIYRGDWMGAAMAGSVVLVLLAALIVRVCCELAVTAAEVLRDLPQLEAPPAPCVVRAPFSYPPWETAPVPVVPAVPDRSGLEVGGRHRKRGVADALRTVRRTYLS